MRMRTIADSFWRDPLLCNLNLTQEDKATLIYFLTSPASNMIGVYQIVWNISGAEMGWTRDQLMEVAARLKTKSLIDFNVDGWIFVKIWWSHNSWKGAFSPKLISHSSKQISMMPHEWEKEFVEILIREGMDKSKIPIPYRYPIDRVAPNSNSSLNINSSFIAEEAFKEMNRITNRSKA